ncbi:MAG: outer membrane beta-barrel protein [Acidobacteria bacterium]|nr:outer membrane beta-barrel protein [Acidobacteriota bacterium]
MIRRIISGTLFAVAIFAAQAGTAEAQQAFTVNLGSFMPRGEDARADNDVLVVNRQYLLFDVGDFTGVTVGGDWAMGLGDYFEAAVGGAYYQHSVPTIYDGWVNTNGNEIEQELKLRIVPVTGMVRIFPLGTKRAFQPYVGAGLGVNFWHYSETGDFVDFADNSIYYEKYVASGTSVGPVATFGVRGRVSPKFSLGVEMRFQWAQADLPNDFLSDKLDLGGLNILSAFTYRF